MDIKYKNDINDLTPDQLNGFFVGWLNHPDPGTHLKILKNSYAVWLAFNGSQCVGFINALSDGLFYSFIPLLEVLPDYKGHGIGTELLKLMLETLENMYAIDIVCDESVAPFYEAKEFGRCVGMVKRNYEKQNGHHSLE
jgi:ribosomal protein S18 acetylase RimI-like enzyme